MSTINTNMPEDEFLAVSRAKIISNFQVISDFIDDSVAVVVPLTLNASSWSSGNYTIINSSITANSVITISPSSTMTSDQYDAIAGAKIVEGSISSGQVVLKSLGTVPTINCPVVVVVEG